MSSSIPAPADSALAGVAGGDAADRSMVAAASLTVRGPWLRSPRSLRDVLLVLLLVAATAAMTLPTLGPNVLAAVHRLVATLGVS